MMRSMFAGVSGLKAHQVRMDLIGNNIANVNTAGYKSSRATFQDMLSQNLRAATAPTGSRGGTNPQQVGLGVTLGSVDVKHTQGNTQPTGYLTDLAIEGDGFFILGNKENRQYTRAGMFGFDRGEGDKQYLVSLLNGEKVQGYNADNDGNIVISPGNEEDLFIRADNPIPARATDVVYFSGNLDERFSADPNVDPPVRRTVQVFDSRGREQTIIVTLSATTTTNEWQWDADWVLVSDRIPKSNPDIANNQEYTVKGSAGSFELQDDQGNVVAASTNGREWTITVPAPAEDIIFSFDHALKDGETVKASEEDGWLRLTCEQTLTTGMAGTDRIIKFGEDGGYLDVSAESKFRLHPMAHTI